MLQEYKDITFFNSKIELVKKRITGTEILFVSSRLWGLYDGITRAHGRIGMLIHQSFERNEYVDWRTDKIILAIVAGISTTSEWSKRCLVRSVV